MVETTITWALWEGPPCPDTSHLPPSVPRKRGEEGRGRKQEEGRMHNECITTNCSDFPDKPGLKCTTTMCVGNNYRCSLRMPLLELLASVLPFYGLLIFRNHYKQGRHFPALHI